MNFLAVRDIRFNPLRSLLGAIGVGFLVTGCIDIVGVYRGIVHDALLTIDAIGADLWVVEGGRAGPFAEASAVSPALDRRAEAISGVRRVRRFVQNNQQFTVGDRNLRIAVTGLDFPTDRGEWIGLSAGRLIEASHYEAIADTSLGFVLGQTVRLGHDDYTIVGETTGHVDMSGDGELFVTVPDALAIADARPSETVLLDRLQGVGPMADRPTRISAVVLSLRPGTGEARVMHQIEAWGDVSVLTAQGERDVLMNSRLWRLRLQILFFAVLLLTVTGVVIAMSIYSGTVEKSHQIAMLKLIGARDSFILGMIMQQALLAGVAAFAVAVGLAYLTAPFFPRRLQFDPQDFAAIFAGLMVGCLAGSWFGIFRALRVRATEVLA